MKVLTAFLFFLCSYTGASPIEGVLKVNFRIKYGCSLPSDFDQFYDLAASVFDNVNVVAPSIISNYLPEIEAQVPSDISANQDQPFQATLNQDLDMSFNDITSFLSILFLGQMSTNNFELSIQFTVPILITPAQPGHPANVLLTYGLESIPNNIQLQIINHLVEQIEQQYQPVHLPSCHIL